MEPRVYELQSEFTWLTGKNISLSLMVLLGAVSVVLVICCTNVSIFSLAKHLPAVEKSLSAQRSAQAAPAFCNSS